MVEAGTSPPSPHSTLEFRSHGGIIGEAPVVAGQPPPLRDPRGAEAMAGGGHGGLRGAGRSGGGAGSGQLTSGEGSQRQQAVAKRGRDPPP